MIIELNNESEMINIGKHIGAILTGGEIIELIGDVGSGKTTLTKGIASGLGVTDNIQSPSFTISRVYKCPSNLNLAHYDFYRLNNAGIMTNEISESISDKKTITVIEWGNIIEKILPIDRISVKITTISESTREVEITSNGENKIIESLMK